MTKFDLTASDLMEIDTTKTSESSDEVTIDLVRPSTKAHHTAQEWREFIAERERAEDRRMVRMAQRLSEMSLRDASEALMGHKLTARLFGSEGGRISLTEIKIGDKNVAKLLEAEIAKGQIAPVREIPLDDEPVRVIEGRIVTDIPEDKQITILTAVAEKLDAAGFKVLVEKLDPEMVRKLVAGLSADTLRRILMA